MRDTAIWDLNSLKAPYIRRIIKSRFESKDLVSKYNTCSLPLDHQSSEEIILVENQYFSVGKSNVDLFKNGTLYTGYYQYKRPFYIDIPAIRSKANSLLNKLIFNIDFKSLPVSIQNQFPYQPDSIRVVTEIESSVVSSPSTNLYINLMGIKAIPTHQTIVQKTYIQTRKTTLAWQDVTRFIKSTKLFKTDTIRKTLFYPEGSITPISVIYYKTPTSIEKIMYRAPDTFKDLPVIEDYKPNLFFFPNPYTTGPLRCELLINHTGLYTLRILNLAGTEISRENLYLDKGVTLDKDLTYLSKGTYFITLEQDRDHVIATKRLFVIKP